MKAALQHDRQAAIVGRGGFGNHALDDFFLQHESHVADVRGKRHQVEQQRGGNVVGQVADDAQVVPQRTEVEFQCVAAVNGEAVGGPGAVQPRDDVAVEFDRMQVRQAVEQGLGQRAEAGADLDDGFARLRMDRVDDGVDDAVVDEEILAEAFAGGVHVRGQDSGVGDQCGFSRDSN